jgi:hypothetical protein
MVNVKLQDAERKKAGIEAMLGDNAVVDVTVTAVDLEMRVAVRAFWEIEKELVADYIHRAGYELIQELGSGAVTFKVTIS